MSERVLQHSIRLALGGIDGVVFWRNNCGVATFHGSVVRYGLSPGSSDIIGIVGGRFCALEVKMPSGRLTEEQKMFLSLVRSTGGFAAVVRSPEEALEAVERCKKGEKQ